MKHPLGQIVFPLTEFEETFIVWYERIVMLAFLTALLFVMPTIFTELLALLGQIFGGFFPGAVP